MPTDVQLSTSDRLRLASTSARSSVRMSAPVAVVQPLAPPATPVTALVSVRPALVALNPEASMPPDVNPLERSRKQPVITGSSASLVMSPGRKMMIESLKEIRLKRDQEDLKDGVAASQATQAQTPAAAVTDLTINPPATFQGTAGKMLASFQQRVAVQETLSASLAAAPAPVVTPPPANLKKLSILSRLQAAIETAPPDGLVADVSDFGDFGDPGEPEEFANASFRQPAAVAQEEIVGRLVTIKEFNGWAIGTLYNVETREEFRVKGEALIGLKEGLEYRLSGVHTTHAQHGEGFDVTSVEPVISLNDDAISTYLQRSFDGIGPAKADKYLNLLRSEGGDEAIEALRNTLLTEPWKVDLTKIDKKAKFSSGEDPQGEIKHLMVTRSLTLRLGRMPGFKESMAKALASNLLNQLYAAHPTIPGQPAPELDVATETWTLLMKNPYLPIRKTEGYGFLTAEAVAALAGLPKTSDLRLSALVEYAVDQGCQRKGHSYLTANQLVEAIHRVDRGVVAQAALNAAVVAGCVVLDGKRVYSPILHTAETELAKNIAKLMVSSSPLTSRTAADVARKMSKDPAKINPTFEKGFDKAQVDAVAGIMTSSSRLHVLTGGPGTGKTAIVEVILALLPNKSFAFAAPTGQAAKVLTGRVSRYGYTASTMHSLLQGSEEGGFKVNAEDPLKVDVLVLDESTMNGLVMANAALSALPPHAHLIVLGDPGLPSKPDDPDAARAGQLPSISPGRFMQDLLLLPNVNHLHLSKTYRNSGGILDVVQQTSRSKLETKDLPAVRFSHGLPEPEKGFPVVMNEYLTSVQRDGIENTLLVMPMRKGDRETPGWNATFANHVLRATCNPHGEKIPGTTMFLGDRIIIRENQKIKQPKPGTLGSVSRAPVYVDSKKSLMERITESRGVKQNEAEFLLDRETGWKDNDRDDDDTVTISVVNGDIGTISAFAMASNNKRLGSPQWLELKLDDGRTVYYPGSEMASLQHSYALTVHSAQGSERTNVIVVVTPGNAEFMNQNMLYTGFSRARADLSIHGDDHVIKKIVATPMPSRNSSLVERSVSEMENLQIKDQDESQEVAHSTDSQF